MIFSGIIGLKRAKGSVGKMVFIIEGTLFLITVVWMIVRKIPAIFKIWPSLFHLYIGLGAGVFLLVSSLIFYLIDGLLFRKRARNLMEKSVYPIFENITFFEILMLAFMSGFCEELFFRGVLMAEFGIIISSLVFGILHTPSMKTWFLGFWTALAGVFFCLLYKFTGNLFVPMVAHALNNLIAVLYVRYILLPLMKKEKEKKAKEESLNISEEIPEEEDDEEQDTVELENPLANSTVPPQPQKQEQKIETPVEPQEALEPIPDDSKKYPTLQDIPKKEEPHNEEETIKPRSPVTLLDPSMVKNLPSDSPLIIHEPDYDRAEEGNQEKNGNQKNGIKNNGEVGSKNQEDVSPSAKTLPFIPEPNYQRPAHWGDDLNDEGIGINHTPQ